jgi:hypothetical protein
MFAGPTVRISFPPAASHANFRFLSGGVFSVVEGQRLLKGKRWGRCCAWSDAVICPAFDAAERQPPACMGVRGPGPNHQSVLEAQWKALVVPALSHRLLRHTLLPLALTSSRSWSAYAAAIGVL